MSEMPFAKPPLDLGLSGKTEYNHNIPSCINMDDGGTVEEIVYPAPFGSMVYFISSRSLHCALVCCQRSLFSLATIH